ncbi:porin [Variovorax robiniae]|uniref:Porin n=1 Tax=Variovorax robiniae TaxID=1836199 RepID=A0ABU8XG38_9BURK
MNACLSRLGAVALLVAAVPAAQAQSSVTVYGVTAMEAVHVTSSYATPAGRASTSIDKLDSSQVNASRLGYRGVEDLGDGLGAVFGLESGFSLDTGATNATTYFNRGSYVGLVSKSLGTLTVGRQWNTNDDIMGNYFIFGGYSAFRFKEFSFISDLVNNAVKYVSPEFAGFKFRALVAPGEGVTGHTAEAALSYTYGGLSIGASYREAEAHETSRLDKLTSVGVSYNFGNFRPHAGYSVSDSKASNLPKARAYDVGLQWTPNAPWVVDLDYVAKDQLDTDNDAHFWRVQATYFFSKRTSVYANVVLLQNDGTSNVSFYGTPVPGQKQNVYSLGLAHKF